MLRCPVGGKATNLTPEDTPQDIYQDVADHALKEVRKLASKGDRMAIDWLNSGLINRKMTKRPVMVVPYGGTLYSCRNYVEDYVREMFYKGHKNPWKNTQLYIPINWITKFIWDAISEVVVSAREAMDWIRDVARKMSRKNIPLVWKTPTDFVVYQQYPNIKKHRIKTTIDGTLIRPTLGTEEFKDIDRQRAVNGSAPNFVHALDASALTNTVYMCNNDGIDSFCMIHDSYGTHAANTPLLAKRLREAFINLYKQYDVLEDFRQSALEVLDEVPEPPKKGNLDLDGIMQSKYFFA
jgi:DNA-directed RNA polymerase